MSFDARSDLPPTQELSAVILERPNGQLVLAIYCVEGSDDISTNSHNCRCIVSHSQPFSYPVSANPPSVSLISSSSPSSSASFSASSSSSIATTSPLQATTTAHTPASFASASCSVAPRCIVHCAECTTAFQFCPWLESAPDIRKLFAKVRLHSQSAKNIWFAPKNNRFAMRWSSMFEQSLIRANVDPKELDCWKKRRVDC